MFGFNLFSSNSWDLVYSWHLGHGTDDDERSLCIWFNLLLPWAEPLSGIADLSVKESLQLSLDWLSVQIRVEGEAAFYLSFTFLPSHLKRWQYPGSLERRNKTLKFFGSIPSTISRKLFWIQALDWFGGWRRGTQTVEVCGEWVLQLSEAARASTKDDS